MLNLNGEVIEQLTIYQVETTGLSRIRVFILPDLNGFLFQYLYQIRIGSQAIYMHKLVD
jgi:hypothetical protein